MYIACIVYIVQCTLYTLYSVHCIHCTVTGVILLGKLTIDIGLVKLCTNSVRNVDNINMRVYGCIVSISVCGGVCVGVCRCRCVYVCMYVCVYV